MVFSTTCAFALYMRAAFSGAYAQVASQPSTAPSSLEGMKARETPSPSAGKSNAAKSTREVVLFHETAGAAAAAAGAGALPAAAVSPTAVDRNVAYRMQTYECLNHILSELTPEQLNKFDAMLVMIAYQFANESELFVKCPQLHAHIKLPKREGVAFQIDQMERTIFIRALVENAVEVIKANNFFKTLFSPGSSLPRIEVELESLSGHKLVFLPSPDKVLENFQKNSRLLQTYSRVDDPIAKAVRTLKARGIDKLPTLYAFSMRTES